MFLSYDICLGLRGASIDRRHKSTPLPVLAELLYTDPYVFPQFVSPVDMVLFGSVMTHVQLQLFQSSQLTVYNVRQVVETFPVVELVTK